MSRDCIPFTEKELANTVKNTTDIYPTFDPISSVFDSVDISDVVEDLPEDLYLECEDDGQYVVETSQETPFHSLIGQNVQLKISFPPSQLYGVGKEDATKSFECSSCPNIFKTEISLKKHMKYEHKITKPYACSMCKYQSVNKRLLTRHCKRLHSEHGTSSSKHVNKNNCKSFVKENMSPQVVKQIDASKTSATNTEVSRHDVTAIKGPLSTCSKSEDYKNFDENISYAGSQNIYLCSHCAYMFSDECLLDEHCLAEHKTLDNSSISQDTDMKVVSETTSENSVMPAVKHHSSDGGNLYIDDNKPVERTMDDEFLANNKLSLKVTKAQSRSNYLPVKIVEAKGRGIESKTFEIPAANLDSRDVSCNESSDMCPTQKLNRGTCWSNKNGIVHKELKATLSVSSENSTVMRKPKSKTSVKLHKTPNENRPVKIHMFNCAECTYKCKQKRTFLLHLKKHENCPKQKNCLHCSKIFLSDSALKRHLKTHNDDRPYQCLSENCKATFKLQGSLTDHLRYVHKITSWSGDSRNNKNDKLINIKGKHKNFVCSWANCDKSFRDNYNLMLHYKCHTGEKGFHCPKCDYACIQKTSFDRHLKKHV